jgi:inner membrane protein
LDTLTHALSGALLARATAPKDAPARSLPRRVAAGFFAAAAPDLDFVIGFIGPVEYLVHHRGATHSILLLPLWALLYSWVLSKMLKEPGGWRALYGVTAMALGAHIVGDLITSFGTIILAPFSDWRAGIGTTFIIDLWLSGVIIAGLAASAIWRRTRVPAVAAFALLAGYIGFQAIQKEKALDFGAQYAASRGLAGARVTVHPRPVSAFNWTVFVSDERDHHFAHVNLVREIPRSYQPGDGFVARLDAPYQPLAQARWETRPRYGSDEARQALESPELAFFRWFADLPAYDGPDPGSGCAWFVDLRFLTPGRDWLPFRYGACRESGAWRLAIS